MKRKEQNMGTEPNEALADKPTPQPATDSAPSELNQNAKGAPNDEQRYNRAVSEREEWKQKYSELEAKLKDGLKAEDLEAVKKEAKAEREALEAKHASALLSASVDLALISAGCRDTAAAKAHIELSELSLKDGKVDGLDATALAKEYPYLFQTTTLKTVGAQPAGTSDKDSAALARVRGAARLKTPSE